MSYISKVALVIPCFNEGARGLLQFHEVLNSCLSQMSPQEYSFSIMYVDDGSTDNSAEALRSIANNDARVSIATLSRNAGKEWAVFEGVRASKDFEFLIIMDSDLEHPPSLIRPILDKLKEGQSIVMGQRIRWTGQTLSRRLGGLMFYKALRLSTSTRLCAGDTDFIGVSAEVAQSFVSNDQVSRLNRAIIAGLPYSLHRLQFEVDKSQSTKTGSSFRTTDLFSLGVESLVANSSAPLIAATTFGLIIAAIGFSLLVFGLLDYSLNLGMMIRPATILTIVNTFLLSSILIVLCICALYLRHMYRELFARKKPEIDIYSKNNR